MEDFKIIVFTPPYPIDEEIGKIRMLLNAGVDYVHIRKPSYDKAQIRNMLFQFSKEELKKLKIHDHFQLAQEFPSVGVHLNGRNPLPPEKYAKVSASVHSLDEIENFRKTEAKTNCSLDYVTLSPIFDSISKPGYSSAFDIDNLRINNDNADVVALGGVTPDKFSLLKEKGFSGAGLLGYIWEGDFESKIKNLKDALREIKNN